MDVDITPFEGEISINFKKESDYKPAKKLFYEIFGRISEGSWRTLDEDEVINIKIDKVHKLLELSKTSPVGMEY